MTTTVLVLATGTTTSKFGWTLGFIIGGVLVVVVAALVVQILLLARSIGQEAPKINGELAKAVHNTAPLAALRTTIEHATIIIGGPPPRRARPGGWPWGGRPRATPGTNTGPGATSPPSASGSR